MIFDVKVITNASKNELVEKTDTYLKVRLNAIPEKGKANEALIKFLAKEFGIRQSDITIIKGLSSKQKKVEIRV